MEKKKIGVTLPPDLHAAVKILATRLGVHVEEAYAEALTRWIGYVELGGKNEHLRSNEAHRVALLVDQALEGASEQTQRMVGLAISQIEVLASMRPLPEKSDLRIQKIREHRQKQPRQ